MLDSSLFWIFMEFLTTGMEAIILKFIFDNASELKKRSYLGLGQKFFVYVSFVIVIVAISIFSILNLNVFVKIFLNFLFALVIYGFNYKTTVLKNILICLSYYLLLVFIDLISSNILMLFTNDISMQTLLKNNLIKLELIILAKSLLLFVVPIVKSIKLRYKFTNMQYVFLILPSLAYTIGVLSLFKIMLNVNFSEKITLQITTISLILFLLNIFTFFILNKNFNLFNTLIVNKIRMSKDYYLNLLNYDIHVSDEFNTKNQMLDLVLQDKKHACSDKNISLSVNLEFSPCDFINNSDVSNIFSNLIDNADNAIDACETVEDKGGNRVIRVSGRACGDKNNMYVFKIIANKVFETNERQRLIDECEMNLSNKETLFSNIYLNSAKKSLEKYNGELVIKMEASQITMIVLFTNLPEFKNKTICQI